MMKEEHSIIQYSVSIQTEYLSIQEISQSVGLHDETIEDYITMGLIDPVQHSPIVKFDISTVTRIQKIIRLQHDFGINLNGVGLVLDLLDRVSELENELDYYKNKMKTT